MPAGPPRDRVRTLVDVLRSLHEHVVTTELECGFVEDVERLVPGAAAAIFRAQDAGELVTRRAAGPRWRTAERDAPAWLSPHSHALAQVVRTGSPLVGEVVFGNEPSHERVHELVQFPLVVDGTWWGALLVLRPADAGSRAEDVWIVDACASHLAAVLTRLSRAGHG